MAPDPSQQPPRSRPPAEAATAPQARPDELVLHELDAAEDGDGGEFAVTTDVSFPLEVQEHDSLADQLQKLGKLHEQGVITAEELAVAKAKLLG